MCQVSLSTFSLAPKIFDCNRLTKKVLFWTLSKRVGGWDPKVQDLKKLLEKRRSGQKEIKRRKRKKKKEREREREREREKKREREKEIL